MCIKAGKDELDTVRNLMMMSLNAVVAEALACELGDAVPEADLVKDLGMDSGGAAALRGLVAEFFDGLEIDLGRARTVADLLDQVVYSAFEEVADQPCPPGEICDKAA